MKYKIRNLNHGLSKEIIEKLNVHLEKKDQVLFFLNRRGFLAHLYFVKNVLKFISCPNCSINLVYHKNKKIYYVIIVGYKGLCLKEIVIKEGICDFILVDLVLKEYQKKLKKIFPF